MIVASTQKQFQPHPAGQFRAVCVDCTEPKEIDSRFGRQTIFKFVFETEATREDGTRCCAWSRPLTPSLHEKANLRKTLKQWRGKDLTSEELRGFDTESMVGVPANPSIRVTIQSAVPDLTIATPRVSPPPNVNSVGHEIRPRSSGSAFPVAKSTTAPPSATIPVFRSCQLWVSQSAMTPPKTTRTWS